MIMDFNGNSLAGTTLFNYSMVVTLVDDLRNPQLQQFDLDMNFGTLTMEFDNVMNPDTLEGSAITIQNAALATAPVYSFIGGTTSSEPGYVIVLDLDIGDLNALKRNRDIATAAENTYIAIAADLISSYGGINGERDPPPGLDVLSIVNGDGVRVRNFTSDTTNPRTGEL